MRFFTLLALILSACSAGALSVAALFHDQQLRSKELYEDVLMHARADRDMYAILATRAVRVCERVSHFAEGYQNSLDICLERLNAPSPILWPLAQGGVGGPDHVWQSGRLP